MYYFRADGSAVTGAGHLMRCLTVAQELQKRIEHPEELCFLCAEQALSLIHISEPTRH